MLEATDGPHALRVVQESREPIDVLLTDMLMPAMSGIELSEQLRELQPQVRVLLMSGYAGDLFQRYRLSTTEMMLIEKPSLATIFCRKMASRCNNDSRHF